MKNKIPIEKRKYRVSIVESMKEDKVKQYGFEKSYFLFERSINRLPKEGDIAEKMALDYLMKKELLSSNYSLNRVITLGRIKIEADIIDYDNKKIYEIKSRKTGIQAKMAIKKKWALFEYDKKYSRYSDFEFIGVVISNYDSGRKIKGIVDFKNSNFDKQTIKIKFQNHFNKIERFREIKK